ncbi:ribosome quality control complex subunit TCF25 isoform X2 [Dendropsophus ebraccatus]|uniref:ribosome quality control complex subunit TCF25 isoform X2 n=1 Tax=Dendropsophus ebraccatus TaxID=150705 RepID=UPI003832253A
MSRRALRRLRGEQRGQEEPGGPDEFEKEEEPLQPESRNRKNKGNRKLLEERGLNNPFQLITEADEDPQSDPDIDQSVQSRMTDEEEPSVQEKPESDLSGTTSTQTASSNKTKKKKKKKKAKKSTPADGQTDGAVERSDELGNIDSILQSIENTNGIVYQIQNNSNSTDTRPLLYVEHRNLNPETELKKFFGSRAVMGDQRPRHRQRLHHRSTWLTSPKNTWPRFSKTGITMSLLETKRGVQYFTFEHQRDYQQVQFKFLDAVESMDPNNIVLLLQMNPYHVDSLLQLSDVCRLQEDQEMARDLIERALYSLECAFHPVFSLTSGTCRLDYCRSENRGFFLALFKHMMFLEKRGCLRTALEYCKLILSLDPENDPLCMLLLVDYLALRAREYLFLIRMFDEWEAHRNLSQLPNFAFSVALALLQYSQQDEVSEQEQVTTYDRASHLIRQALIMFPGVLIPLLDVCGVQPDSAVASHPFFGAVAQISQPAALSQLTSLYIGRCHSLWKEPSVMSWLEQNVQEVLRMVDRNDPVVKECELRRKTRYQSAPRNIHRHVILSEIKGANSALPLEVTSQPMLSFDPLPPLDSVVSYTRPERTNRPSNEGTLSLFFRSLLPNFNLQGEIAAEGEDAGAVRDLNRGVNRLMAAMRDMLANIQFQEPPREDNPDGEGDEEWD